MSYSLFLDDERLPKNVTWIVLPLVEWVIVRNYNEFVAHITKYGIPNRISFDHDLAKEHYEEGRRHNFWEFNYDKVKEKTGFHCAKWLVDYCLDTGAKLPEWYTHSMNPVGCENINSLLHSFKKYESGK